MINWYEDAVMDPIPDVRVTLRDKPAGENGDGDGGDGAPNALAVPGWISRLLRGWRCRGGSIRPLPVAAAQPTLRGEAAA